MELRQAISRLIEDQIQTIMVAQAEGEYAFRIVDPPRVPNQRISRKRRVIVMVATFLGGMIGVFVALLHCAICIRRASEQ